MENASVYLKDPAVPVWTEGMSFEDLEREFNGLNDKLIAEGVSPALRRAELQAFLLRRAPVAADPQEIYPDYIGALHLMEKMREKLRGETARTTLVETAALSSLGYRCKAFDGNADYGHVSFDWCRALRLGFPGLLAEVKKARSLNPGHEDFYAAEELVLEAVLDWVRRLAALTGSVADSPVSRAAAARLQVLTERAPETMAEAYHFMALLYTAVQELEGENLRSMGRLDQTLLPFLRHDLEAGVSREELKLYTRAFFLKCRSYHFSANVPFTLAGVDENGEDAVNEMSYFLIETYHEAHLHDPKIQVRVSKKTPDRFVQACINCIRDGMSSFVFMNDEAVVNSLISLGIDQKDARNYLLIGCYEPGAYGELPRTCSGSVSLPKAVELAMSHGCDMATGERITPDFGGDFESFDAFLQAVLATARELCRASVKIISDWELQMFNMHQAPILSALIPASVRSGRDIYDGGALYNNGSVNVMGVATAADSLAAVRQLVYEEKQLSFEELALLMKNNWADQPMLRQRAITRCPKYGNGIASVDSLAALLTDACAEEINGKPNNLGGVFRMGMFSIDWCIPWGKDLAATPDGRLAGEPFSKNFCPTIGLDRSGVTPVLRSAAAPNAEQIPNGTVLDLMLHPTMTNGEAGLEAMTGFLRGFLESGGPAIQFNIFDAETLRDARVHPEKYQTLQVRVCGWNAFFVTLTPLEQETFIRRAEAVC